jgi:hypothetical protein
MVSIYQQIFIETLSTVDQDEPVSVYICLRKEKRQVALTRLAEVVGGLYPKGRQAYASRVQVRTVNV